MATRLVNLKNESYDVYIGRGSKWGCPFTIIKDRPTLAKEIVGSKEGPEPNTKNMF